MLAQMLAPIPMPMLPAMRRRRPLLPRTRRRRRRRHPPLRRATTTRRPRRSASCRSWASKLWNVPSDTAIGAAAGCSQAARQRAPTIKLGATTRLMHNQPSAAAASLRPPGSPAALLTAAAVAQAALGCRPCSRVADLKMHDWMCGSSDVALGATQKLARGGFVIWGPAPDQGVCHAKRISAVVWRRECRAGSTYKCSQSSSAARLRWLQDF